MVFFAHLDLEDCTFDIPYRCLRSSQFRQSSNNGMINIDNIDITNPLHISKTLSEKTMCVYVYTLKDFFVPIISNRYLKSHYNPIQSHQIPLITTKSPLNHFSKPLHLPFSSRFLSQQVSKKLFPFAILSHSP